MIVVSIAHGRYKLRWLSGQWRDEAGHVWKMDRDHSLQSREHGLALPHQWSIPSEESDG